MAKKQIPNWGWIIIVVLVAVIITKVDIGDVLMGIGSNSFVIQPGEEIKSCTELCSINNYPIGFEVNSKQECIDTGGKSYVTQGYAITVPSIKCCCDNIPAENK